MRLPAFWLFPSLLAACAPAPMPDGGSGDGRVYITDRRGERWDITHAVHQYQFNPRYFEYGIGRHAIPPLDQPSMSAPGDADYPPASSGHAVIGFQVEGEARSYPIQQIVRHEIVNESVRGTQAAVAY